MGMYKYRSPDSFPLCFHAVLHARRASAILDLEPMTEMKARAELRRFQVFRSMLRQTPAHPLHDTEAKLCIRAKIMLGAKGYAIRVTIKNPADIRRRPKVKPDADDEILKKLEQGLIGGV